VKISIIDLFVSNAVYCSFEGLEGDIGALDRMWGVHVKAHLYAARAVLPGMVARGKGYLLKTVFKKDSSIASKYWQIHKVLKNYSETRSYSSYSSCFSNRISFRKA
jgi:NADP-dependent 3-hydroxy acid dehydrogenase YdfG